MSTQVTSLVLCVKVKRSKLYFVFGWYTEKISLLLIITNYYFLQPNRPKVWYSARLEVSTFSNDILIDEKLFDFCFAFSLSFKKIEILYRIVIT